MKYVSTRNKNVFLSASETIAQGLADDGGLLTPEVFPKLTPEMLEDLRGKTYAQRAVAVMKLFLDNFSEEELTSFTEAGYASTKFDDPKVAPLHPLNDDTYCLELWHGPTSAFKDMALQILPHLLSASLVKNNEKKTVCILVATSGDTGKAALEGFKDVKGTKILVFYPKDGVSKVQALQMQTQEGGNVGVCATLTMRRPVSKPYLQIRTYRRTCSAKTVSCPRPTPSTGAGSCRSWSITSPPTATC